MKLEKFDAGLGAFGGFEEVGFFPGHEDVKDLCEKITIHTMEFYRKGKIE